MGDNMKIGYLGAGTWGTALSFLLNDNGHELIIWDKDTDLLKKLDEERVHPKLPGFVVPSGLRYVFEIEKAIEDVDIIIESVSSSGIRPVFEKLMKLKGKDLPPIVITSKGIEQKTGLLFPEVAIDVFGESFRSSIACISGPSHAEEVVKKMPTLLVGSSYERSLMETVVKMFNSDFCRVYPNNDIIGVSFGGAMKNIIAIACGISDGLNYGDNTKAAILTRGLHELRKLSQTKECDPNTLNGLSGLGDLFVTCASTFSRNYRFGKLIAKGYSLDSAKEEIGMVVEGVYSCVSAYELAKKNNIPVPITESVHSILYLNFSPKDIVKSLLQREIKEEHL
jgi:glycerol-3-phosphate dehydrogenase (NAD(P)+)